MKKRTLIIVALAGYAVLIALLVFAEAGRPDASIQTLSDAVWYSVVTLTTVGYGDYFPVTPLGKLVGTALIIGSLGLIGMLIGVITEFISERREMRKMGLYGTDFENHIVIVGWDDFARSVTRQLVAAGNRVAVITDSKDHIDLIYEEFSKDQMFVLFADLKHIAIFEKANIAKAALTFVNLDSDTDKLIDVLNIKGQYPDMRFLVAVENPDLKKTFHNAGVSHVLSKNEIASKLIASYIFETDVADYANDLLSTAERHENYDIQQFRITENNPLAGKTYGDAFQTLKREYNVVLIGLSRSEGGRRALSKLPPDDLTIAHNDYLIMILNGEKEAVMEQLFGVKEGIHR